MNLIITCFFFDIIRAGLTERSVIRFRRCCYATGPSCLISICREWMAMLTQSPPSVTTDVVDLERVSQLHRTLPFLTDEPLPTEGQPLRPGHHLVYFQPRLQLGCLVKDGTSPVSRWPAKRFYLTRINTHLPSQEYNALAPYSRRMWAGGSLEFHPTADITVGSTLMQTTSVASVEHTAVMIFVIRRGNYTRMGDIKCSLARSGLT
jgi:hydroxyacyl-ACP dehydratase HTD2-like protein with hotdog domain